MKLLPLNPPNGAIAERVLIACAGCHKRGVYGPASREDWTFDCEGKAFHDYYCADCSQLRNASHHN